MGLFDDFAYYLKLWGVHDVLLPFLLVFTLVYAILQKSHILGEPDEAKNFNTIVSLIMGLAVVIPHVLYFPEYRVVAIINQALPQVSLVVVAVIMFLLMLGIFGKEVGFAGTSLSGWAVLFSLLAVLVIFGSSAGWWYMPDFLRFLNYPEIQSLIIIILVFGLIIWFVTKDPSKNRDERRGKLIKRIGEVLG